MTSKFFQVIRILKQQSYKKKELFFKKLLVLLTLDDMIYGWSLCAID